MKSLWKRSHCDCQYCCQDGCGLTLEYDIQLSNDRDLADPLAGLNDNLFRCWQPFIHQKNQPESWSKSLWVLLLLWGYSCVLSPKESFSNSQTQIKTGVMLKKWATDVDIQWVTLVLSWSCGLRAANVAADSQSCGFHRGRLERKQSHDLNFPLTKRQNILHHAK